MHREEMYEQYAKPVYRYLYSLCGEADTAEELCAETFYRAVKGIDRYDGSCKLLTWLCSIAKHAWYGELDKRRRRGEVALEDALPLADLGPGPEVGPERAEERVELYRRMQALDPQTREVMYLRTGCELSYREIGAVLGKTENWARVTFYRGKEKMKKGWQAHEREGR